jgi:hypothetical protein
LRQAEKRSRFTLDCFTATLKRTGIQLLSDRGDGGSVRQLRQGADKFFTAPLFSRRGAVLAVG